MKNHYIFILLITFSLSTFSQVRIVEVDPSTDTITLENFGATTVDVSSYWFCARFQYRQLNAITIESGSLNLATGQRVVLSGQPLNDTSSDVCLYSTNSFTITTAMLDFMQYGTAADVGRLDVAVAKGIWVNGAFISVPPIYSYSGNATDAGVSFWQTLLGVNDFDFEKSTRIYPNPNKGEFTIKSETSNLTKIKIYSILGSLVYEKDYLQQQAIDFNIDLNSGLYLVEINSNKIFKRIVIE